MRQWVLNGLHIGTWVAYRNMSPIWEHGTHMRTCMVPLLEFGLHDGNLGSMWEHGFRLGISVPYIRPWVPHGLHIGTWVPYGNMITIWGKRIRTLAWAISLLPLLHQHHFSCLISSSLYSIGLAIPVSLVSSVTA